MKRRVKAKGTKTEKEVEEFYMKQGYNKVRHGWPDRCFYKKRNDGITEYIFVEVKTEGDEGITCYQQEVRDIFKKLGLYHRVCFGVYADGSPRFSETAKNKSPVSLSKREQWAFKETNDKEHEMLAAGLSPLLAGSISQVNLRWNLWHYKQEK